MLTSSRVARLSAFVLLTSTVVPAGAVYTSQYAGSATSSAGASTEHISAPPFERTLDYPADISFRSPISSTTVTGSTTLGANAGNGTAFSSASFMATAGGLHIAAVASATGAGVPGWSSGGSSSSYADAVSYDAFVVTTSSYAPGAVFTVTAGLSMTGSVGAMGFRSPAGADGSFDALASWQAEVQVYNSTMLFPVNERASSACWDNPSVGMGCGGAGFSTLGLTFTVANGQPTDLLLLGQVRARASAGATHGGLAGADAWSDLGHTIAWGGIESVVDGAGNPIDTYTAFSQTTGFDYRNAYVSAVPEPRIWLLLMVGMLVTVLFRASRSAPHVRG